ncbi:MAG: transglutaminase family protein [Reyranella sp.]|uniref:transglutaminase family protein n=1 Tax=Reyranella sp. TaxID=1929291 RepID=UPI001AD1ECF3|nr:transglutaminase family protein [Reyranella sp.]MBN9089364.1 transglutaminase family protein [Reyranella sp.]
MQYLLSHRTTYTYDSSVDSAHHIAHLRARAFPGQKVSSIGIVTQPLPALAVQHVDHFGNLIDIYRIDKPHQRFDIEVRASIDVCFPEPPPAADTPPWEEIRKALSGGGFPASIEASEFVHDSPLVPGDDSLRTYGATSLTPGRPILDAARELTARIKADFDYHPGATDISTPLHDVFEGKAGVCQDFAHVMIAALRAHGVAAAYVSGYIRTLHSPQEVELRGADASHAWVAVWCGEAAGWVHLDPTNDLVAHEDHIAVAWGRDFSDVSPLRGVILGGGNHVYSVAVTLVPTG